MTTETLPDAWHLAIKSCPYCAGMGHTLDDQGDAKDCPHCAGSGSLIGTWLLDAWQRGADHVLARVREVEASRQIAVERATTEKPSMDDLMRAMGLR